MQICKQSLGSWNWSKLIQSQGCPVSQSCFHPQFKNRDQDDVRRKLSVSKIKRTVPVELSATCCLQSQKIWRNYQKMAYFHLGIWTHISFLNVLGLKISSLYGLNNWRRPSCFFFVPFLLFWHLEARQPLNGTMGVKIFEQQGVWFI